ncbi:glycosyl hydrolase [Catenuloplanes japonicus]|uniref:glycosyl hydrolase n=1 Tax=Catenuloplanes japonicus TaxID=33876 RepID=UPI000525CDB0|nr:glycosyl hydrolase [Catenuloplanes japonicus]
MSGLKRRTVLALGAGTLAAGWGAAPAQATQRNDFADPETRHRPYFRWWWPDGLVDPAEIRREVDQIAAAGFGGAEIAAVHHSIRDKSVLDTAHHGWGSAAWTRGVEAALDQAATRGITIDLTIGPSWPAAVPTITPDSPAAVQELAHAAVTVAAGGTFDGPVPASASPWKQTLIAVQAVRVDPANSTRKETGLAADSVTDLTAHVTGGRLAWTAPADGEHLLLAYWQRGSGQEPESGPHTSPDAFVVDHFSAAGTQAVIDFWEARLLTPRVRALLRRSGGSLFEDSIELETAALNWTPALLAQFQSRRGYDLRPFLAAVVRVKESTVYAFDAATSRRVRADYWQTLSDLFTAHHFTPLTRWAHSLGLTFRAQPYGLETDAISVAAVIDVPEGESLGFKNLDDYRCLAGGRDMGGRALLSCEAGAYQGGAYNTTWKKLLRTMGGAYAAGLNQTVFHGFSYASAPGAGWPGYAAFTPYSGAIGYAESWGPRQPSWRHVPDVAAYLGRVHLAGRIGVNRIDAAVFRQKGYTKTGIGASWFTSDGIPSGWTHQMISAPLLALPSATVRDGRLAPDGPAYRVLLVETDLFSGNVATLDLPSARRILALARKGLPVVLLGDWSAATTPGRATGDEDTVLRALLAELTALPKVRTVAVRTDVGAALASLGLTPAVSYAQASTLLHGHRVLGDADYYYLVNGKHAETVKPAVAAIDHDVTLQRASRRAVPYRIDPWTGVREPIAHFTADGDRVTIRVALQPGESSIVVLAPGPSARHVTATTADRVVARDRDLVLRAAAAGSYTATLDDGRTVTRTIGAVPAPIPLTRWTLRVADWQPGSSATETLTVTHALTLDALKPWPEIPELADVSGVGRYTTEADVPACAGAYLSLGEVFDTCRVTVNGRPVTVSPLHPVADVGPLLRRGRNTIEVEVATTLNNRLRVADPAVYGVASRQSYGLTGPVTLIPYGESRI